MGTFQRPDSIKGKGKIIHGKTLSKKWNNEAVRKGYFWSEKEEEKRLDLLP